MDKSMWPTTGQTNLKHSSHRWLPIILSCRQHGLAVSTGFVGCWTGLRFCRRTWGLKVNIGGDLMYFGHRAFVPTSWMCKKQTSVSHSSTESKIISLDAGLRMDGLPALDLWDVGDWSVAFDKQHQNPQTPKPKPKAGNCLRDPKRDRTSKPKQKGNRDVDQLSHVDHVPTTTLSSDILFFFLERVRGLISWRNGCSFWPGWRQDLQCQEPRVALDWLCDRINMDSKIQIKCADKKSHLADMVTKGSFTRDEWKHLLCLLNIINFSMFSCSHVFLSNRKQSAVSKRRWRRYFRRRFGDGKAEVYEFGDGETKTYELGVTQLVECEEEFSVRFERFQQPVECQSATRWCFNLRLETDAGYEPESSRVFSSEATFHRILMQSVFFGSVRGLISECSYSFWRWKELFLKQLNGCSFWPEKLRWSYFFKIYSFSPLCEIHPKAVDAQITWSFTLRKLECFRHALVVNTVAWNNKIGLVAYFVGLCATSRD